MKKDVKPAAAPPGAQLIYYGGPVISNVKIVEVLYGDAGVYIPEIGGNPSPSVQSFYGGVTSSALFDWISEYDTDVYATPGVNGGLPGTDQAIGRGTFSKKTQIVPSGPNNLTQLDDSNIKAEILHQVSIGKLPPADGQTLMMFHFPEGVSITLGGSGSCVGGGFCAYHGTIANPDGGADFYYGVLPDMGPNSGCHVGCGGDPLTFNNQTSVASHELIEAVTDSAVGLAAAFAPPLAWYDQNNGEIGDICNANQGTVLGGDGITYTIQKEFSNNAQDCIATNPNAPPDFFVGVAPVAVDLPQLGTATLNVTTQQTHGAAGTLALSMTGLPAGITAAFNPASVMAGSPSTVTLTATNDLVTAGVGNAAVTATGPSGVHYGFSAVTLHPLMVFTGVPGDQTIEATGPTGATGNFTPPTALEGATNETVTCAPASGTTFALGTTTVTCSATDAQNRTAKASFTIKVQDTTPPTMPALPNVTAEATSAAGAVVTLTLTATDLVDVTDPVICVPASGTTFALGTTPVNCTSTDAAGNSSTGTFNVLVQDTTPPVLTLPSNLTVAATSNSGAVVSYTVTAVDAVDGPRQPNCSPAAGSTFPVGTSTVTCFSVDVRGNTSHGTFTVTVTNTQGPVITVPGDLTVEATSKAGAAVNYTVTAVDPVSGVIGVTCTPPSGNVFPIATTPVTCTATNPANVSATATFHVKVQDTTPPSLSCPADVAVSSTSATGATVDYPAATATDAVTPVPTVTYSQGSGTVFPISTTLVTVTAKDEAGNSSKCSFNVTVNQAAKTGCSATGTGSADLAGLCVLGAVLAGLSRRRRSA